MIKNVSSEFKQELMKHYQNFVQKIEILFFDDEGVLYEQKTIAEDKIMDSGMSFSSATSSTDSFDVGAAVIASASIAISNENDWLSEYNFEHAKMIPYVGLKLEDGTIEYVKKGVFNMENPQTKGSIISMETLDNMSLFEKPLSDVNLTYPISAISAVNRICLHCGVTFRMNSFTNSDLMLQNPEDDNMTCLDAIGYMAQISCSFAKCNVDGALEFQWYDFSELNNDSLDGGVLSDYTTGDIADGGNLTDYSSGDIVDGGDFGDFNTYHHFYMLMNTPTIYVNDTVITGCKITYSVGDEDKELTVGDEGYMLNISDNPFISTDAIANAVAESIKDKTIGIAFRKCSFSPIYNPLVEAGDVGYLTDYNWNRYKIIISNMSGVVGGTMSISSDSETMSKNQSNSSSSTTALIKKYVSKEKNARELATQQLAQELATSSGLFITTVPQPDGSNIYYMHDKKTLEDSTIVWKITAEAFGLSTDGGKTYPYGLDVSGTAILDKIYAVGIIADYIVGGTIEGEIIAKNLSMQGGGINIEADGERDNKIELVFESKPEQVKVTSRISPFGITAQQDDTYKGVIERSASLDTHAVTVANRKSGENISITAERSSFTKLSSVDSIWSAGKIVAGSTTSYFTDRMLSVIGDATISGSVHANGNITCSGSKNRAVKTEDGLILMNAYETSSALFGDVGIGVIDEDGECRIYIDPTLMNVIASECDYHVFISKYCESEMYVAERKKDYFIVKGTPGESFSWELKATQKGYENVRNDVLEIRDESDLSMVSDLKDYSVDIDDDDYSDDGIEAIKQYEKEMLKV